MLCALLLLGGFRGLASFLAIAVVAALGGTGGVVLVAMLAGGLHLLAAALDVLVLLWVVARGITSPGRPSALLTVGAAGVGIAGLLGSTTGSAALATYAARVFAVNDLSTFYTVQSGFTFAAHVLVQLGTIAALLLAFVRARAR